MSTLFFAAQDHFTFFTLLGMDHKYLHVAMTALTSILLILFATKVYKAYHGKEEEIVPSPRFSLKNFVELLVEAIYGFVHDVLGKDTKKHFPFLATIFLFVAFNDLSGAFAGFSPSTSNLNTNFAISILVFLYYNYQGIQKQGWHYIQQFTGPLMLLGPFMIIVEVISHLIRPLSLSLRLFGNMQADHMVLGAFSNLVPPFVPMIFLSMGIFVSLLQAFIFTILTSIYIQMATSEH